MHTSYLHIFRYLARKLLEIRKYSCVVFIQFNEKSDCAIRIQSLCGAAYNDIIAQTNAESNHFSLVQAAARRHPIAAARGARRAAAERAAPLSLCESGAPCGARCRAAARGAKPRTFARSAKARPAGRTAKPSACAYGEQFPCVQKSQAAANAVDIVPPSSMPQPSARLPTE